MITKIEAYFDGKHWCARGVGISIFTHAITLDELFKNIAEAVSLHFEEDIKIKKYPEVLILSELSKKNVSKIAAN